MSHFPKLRKRYNFRAISKDLDSLIHSCEGVSQQRLSNLSEMRNAYIKRVRDCNRTIKRIHNFSCKDKPTERTSDSLDKYIKQKQRCNDNSDQVLEYLFTSMNPTLEKKNSFKLMYENMKDAFKKHRRKFGSRWKCPERQTPNRRTPPRRLSTRLPPSAKPGKTAHLKKVLVLRLLEASIAAYNKVNKKQRIEFPQISVLEEQSLPRKESISSIIKEKRDTITDIKVQQMIVKAHEKERQHNRNKKNFIEFQ